MKIKIIIIFSLVVLACSQSIDFLTKLTMGFSPLPGPLVSVVSRYKTSVKYVMLLK